MISSAFPYQKQRRRVLGSEMAYVEVGSWSAKEIVDFAKRFDPQGIHTDREAAAHAPFGGLIASGGTPQL